MSNKEALIGFIVIAFFVALAVFITITRWQECREVFSFLYCFTSK